MYKSRDSGSEGKERERIVAQFEPGCSTAAPSNRNYRLGKLRDYGVLRGRWLDCGAAEGGYTVMLPQMGADSAVGVDPEEARISEARRLHGGNNRVEFHCASAEALPFTDASFDGVFLNEVLEHVRDEAQTLQELWRVLKQGGYLVVMTPNRGFPFEGHGMRVNGRDINVPIPFLPWVPNSIAQPYMRARNYLPHELQRLVCEAGFVIRRTGFLFPMFEVYRWLPAPIVRHYRALIPLLERSPLIQRLGNSACVVAQKAIPSAETR
ncbi:MAG: hypothetical protein NVSMB52_21030 [Chloroflexota bacterium]